MCENLNPDRVRCDACRTINLAKHVSHPKPDMQMYDKCSPAHKVYCPRVPGKHEQQERARQSNNATSLKLQEMVISFPPAYTYKRGLQEYSTYKPPQQLCSPELPVHPTCIKVCDKEEYKLRKSGKTAQWAAKVPHYAHGKLMYAVKAGILVGAVYFTYTQGVWGDQRDVTECIRRWQEYVRSINTRRPPTFDQCGNVIRKESSESLVAPLYSMYKSFVTTSFSGVVKIPLIVKCAYIDYLKALERRQAELDKERKIRKKSG